ncbi:hypothetical protein BGX27_004131 [Mortierella sp. AM989]|nr:hypothetical protein BGX27_004131 [Mortierella sp. AM989]
MQFSPLLCPGKGTAISGHEYSWQGTHRFRGTGARHTQEAGADPESIAQHRNWSTVRLTTHCLDSISPRVALRMAGFKMDNERLWLPRNTYIPPVELQRQIFPFIEEYFDSHLDWLALVNNIMLDREEHTDRPPNDRMVLDDDEKYCLMIFLSHLVHLKKVILQDAAALMELQGQFDYGLHHIFGDPVFKGALFSNYRAELHQLGDISNKIDTGIIKLLKQNIEQQNRASSTTKSSSEEALREVIDLHGELRDFRYELLSEFDRNQGGHVLNLQLMKKVLVHLQVAINDAELVQQQQHTHNQQRLQLMHQQQLRQIRLQCMQDQQMDEQQNEQHDEQRDEQHNEHQDEQ